MSTLPKSGSPVRAQSCDVYPDEAPELPLAAYHKPPIVRSVVTEDDRWFTRPDPDGNYRYNVSLYGADGVLVESRGFDLISDAAWFASFRAPMATLTLPDPDTDPTVDDRAWWARETGGGLVEGGPDPTDLRLSTDSALSHWTDTLDPDYFDAELEWPTGWFWTTGGDS